MKVVQYIRRLMLIALFAAAGILTVDTATAEVVTSAQNYVPGELLVVPKQGMQVLAANSISSMGASVKQQKIGATSFMRVRLKPGANMLTSMAAMQSQPWVQLVQPNYIYHTTAVPNDTRYTEYWGLKNTGQVVNGSPAGTVGVDMDVETAWDITTNCSSIVVAVIDSGVDYNHPELSGNIWTNTGEVAGNGIDDDGNGLIDDVRGWDFVQGDNDPMDFNHHGTHVAGTIGATGNNAQGGTGVCWSSKIMPVRVMNSVGSGTTADIVAGINYAVANGAKIINMSLGGTGGGTGDVMDLAIAAADAAGVLVVAAAGNSTLDNDVTPHYPASYNQPNIISVAAISQQNALASFSNWGATSVDIAAPGVDILSTVPPTRVAPAGCSWNFDAASVAGWTLTGGAGLDTYSAFSGTYSLGDSPGGALYANNSTYGMATPACNLSGQQGAVLQFMLDLYTEIGVDIAYADIGSGGVWTNLVGFSGHSAGWLGPFEYDMGAFDNYANAQAQFRLVTNASVVYNGLNLDDVAITVPGTTYAGTEYQFLDGTSMATPNVAGAAALVWAAEPALTHTELRTRLLATGDSVPALSGKVATGRSVNVRKAMPVLAPSGVTPASTPGGSLTSVDISWTDNSINETSFQVQRDAGAGFSTIATVAANSTSYTDANAPTNVPFAYRVVAVTADGRSASGTHAGTMLITPAPAAGGGGGGGCMIHPMASFDPALLLLLALAGAGLMRRRKHD